MQDIWSVRFTCLLVCRSAIFIDSKRGGNRAAPWQEGDIEFIGEDNVPSASYTYVVTGAYDNFGGKVSIGAEEYLSRINIKVYEGDENGNLVFEGGAAECLAWADGYCGDC